MIEKLNPSAGSGQAIERLENQKKAFPWEGFRMGLPFDSIQDSNGGNFKQKNSDESEFFGYFTITASSIRMSYL